MKRLALLRRARRSARRSGSGDAHPLGNFTVNRFSAVELSGDRVYVKYVLDMAEIPTFQERQKIATSAATSGTSRAGSAAGSTCGSTAGRSCSPRSTTRSPSRPGRPACARCASRPCTLAAADAPGASSSATRTSAAGSAGRRSSSRPDDGASAASSSGPVDERQPRARRVPEGPPEQPARGHDRDARSSEPGDGAWQAAAARVAATSSSARRRSGRPATAASRASSPKRTSASA